MPRFLRTCMLVAATLFATGCAEITERAKPFAGAENIPVYETVPPGPRPYRVVKRIWGEKWQSSFRLPQYASADEGAADLKNQAAALGGDAIMFFSCYRVDPSIPHAEKPALFCNGNVIKYGS